MKNLAGLMKQASQMQQKMGELTARLEAMEVDGEAGAGMVRVRLTGKGALRSVTIDPRLADPAEMETLQDLLVAAHADAKRKAEAASAEAMKDISGGLELPAGFKLPF
jgi:DNA-binding YbaB/EbfC family protein